MPGNFMQFRIDRTWCNLLFFFLFHIFYNKSIIFETEYPSIPLIYLILLISIYSKNLQQLIIKKVKDLQTNNSCLFSKRVIKKRPISS